MNGWYKQYRNLFDREWSKDPMMVSVYAYLHCIAYVQTGKLHGQIIHRGSCLTSRAAIMEGTGLSEQSVKTRLKKLAEYGEIIMNPSNLGTIITLCDYDTYQESDGFFAEELSNEKPNEEPAKSPAKSPARNQPIYIKEDRIENIDNLLSTYGPYENERERHLMVKEIQEKYNRMFDGRLPKYTKLFLKMEMKVAECVARFGRQCVDLVLDQVSKEPFSMGENKTGFKASFQYIFEPSEFQKYLERAQLRLRKRESVSRAVTPPAVKAETEEVSLTPKERRRKILLLWVESETRKPTARGQNILMASYESGELSDLGIDWHPAGEASVIHDKLETK